MKMTEHRESPAGNSQLKLYLTCPRKWAWKYLKGFKSSDKAEPLNLGSAVHEAQETFYLTGSEQKALDKGNSILVNLGWNPELEPDIYARFNVGVKEWIKQLGQLDLDSNSVEATEKQYELKLSNGYVMTIRVDTLMKDAEIGRYIRDTKTTKSNPEGTIQQYMYDPQPILYISALRQNGVEVEGWKTDAIAMAVLKAGPRAQIKRSDLVCPPDAVIRDVEDAYTDLTYNIKESINAVSGGSSICHAFPRNPLSCYNYYKPCPYYNICHSIDEVEEPTLGFTMDPWLKERTVLSTFDAITYEE